MLAASLKRSILDFTLKLSAAEITALATMVENTTLIMVFVFILTPIDGRTALSLEGKSENIGKSGTINGNNHLICE
ncbi:hypothetical protein TUM4637_28980 [Shewanella hafniensis]|nr:hypothetical protein TUM4637_28980 [Shewanella hafniensis]